FSYVLLRLTKPNNLDRPAPVVPGSLSGCPVANVQAGFNAEGLPMGLQIIGPHQADFAVLQLAHAYERASRWFERQPSPLLAN
ncbi:amidase family protein, partial [Pseudomonas aeruginosa]